jgi:hypothetical protein
MIFEKKPAHFPERTVPDNGDGQRNGERIAPHPNRFIRRASSADSAVLRKGDSLRHVLISSVVRPQPTHHLLRGSNRQTSVQGESFFML